MGMTGTFPSIRKSYSLLDLPQVQQDCTYEQNSSPKTVKVFSGNKTKQE